MSATIRYKGQVIRTIDNGQTIELDCANKKFTDNLFIESRGRALMVEPYEVATEEEMNTLLNSSSLYDNGKIYKYTGEGKYYLGATENETTIGSCPGMTLTDSTIDVSCFVAKLYEADTLTHTSSPITTKQYLLAFEKAGTKYFFTGAVENGCLVTSTDQNQAVNVQIAYSYKDNEIDIAGYHFFVTNDETKQYINLNEMEVKLTTDVPAHYFTNGPQGEWVCEFSKYTNGAYYRLEVL